MALELRYPGAAMYPNGLDPRQGFQGVDLPTHALQVRPSGITLWRPEIVLAKTGPSAAARPPILIAEPALRPAAVRAQMDSARSALESLAEARQRLDGGASARERAVQSGTERQRVAAMIETYRAQTELETTLRATLRQVAALMEQRGLR